MIQALLKAGIREPTASELAELPHMSEEYLQAHLRGARQNRLQLGAAIEAMRLKAPPPGSEARTPADRQAEVAEKIRNFLEGP